MHADVHIAVMLQKLSCTCADLLVTSGLSELVRAGPAWVGPPTVPLLDGCLCQTLEQQSHNSHTTTVTQQMLPGSRGPGALTVRPHFNQVL